MSGSLAVSFRVMADDAFSVQVDSLSLSLSCSLSLSLSLWVSLSLSLAFWFDLLSLALSRSLSLSRARSVSLSLSLARSRSRSLSRWTLAFSRSPSLSPFDLVPSHLSAGLQSKKDSKDSYHYVPTADFVHSGLCLLCPQRTPQRIMEKTLDKKSATVIYDSPRNNPADFPAIFMNCRSL